MAELFLFLATAFFASVVGAISGIGGGILIRPVLDMASGLSVAQISFLSGTTVLIMAFVSLLRYRAGLFNFRNSRYITLAIGGVFGGFSGKKLFSLALGQFPYPSLLGSLQSGILFLLCGICVLYTLKKNAVQTRNIENPLFCVFVGFGIGNVSAFLGIGGGPFNIVVLSYFFSMDSKTAAIGSLLMIFVSQTASLATLLVSSAVPAVPASFLVLLPAGAVAGSVLGSFLSKKIKHKSVDRIFAIALTLVMVLCLYNCLAYLDVLHLP